MTLTDTVSYENLLADRTYTVKGTLMNKKTGTITFIFDAKACGLEGKETVVSEEIYCNGGLVAEHKDINDEGQFVWNSLSPQKEQMVRLY